MKNHNIKSSPFLKLLLLPLVALAGSVSAHGATRVWSGNTSSTWSVGDNWGGTAPNGSISTSTGDFAQFSATTLGRMPNVAGTRGINGMTFSNRDWQLNNTTVGGILSVGGNGIAVESPRTVDLNTLISVNSQSWTTNGSGILNVNQAVTEIAGGPHTLTKAASGTLNLNASLTVGTLSLSGGFFVLGADNLLGDSMKIQNTTAANLLLNNFSDSAGTLGLGTGNLALNFGTTPGANSFSFADSSLVSWGVGILIIQNFDIGLDTLRFGATSGALTPGQLSQIRFGTLDGPLAQIDSFGYITPLSASPYNIWAGGTFANPFPEAERGPEVDFDNDGLSNLLEFVLGGDPTISQADVRPTVTAAGSNLSVTFKRSDASETQPVTVKVQVSADLVTWNPADDITIGAVDGSGPNGATYTVDDTGDLDTIVVTIPKNSAGKKFARVIAIQ